MLEKLLLLLFLLTLYSCKKANEDAIIPDTKIQNFEIPDTYTNLNRDDSGQLVFTDPESGKRITANENEPQFTINNFRNMPVGTAKGITFDFIDPDLSGKLYYGFILQDSIRFEQPIFFKRFAKIKKGRATIEIKGNLEGKYDIVKWNDTERFKLGYRIENNDGVILYDGKINVIGKGPFKVAPSIIEGPFLNILTDTSAVISFTTNEKFVAEVRINGTSFKDKKEIFKHEIPITGLKPATNYRYRIFFRDLIEGYDLTTAPSSGSRKNFTFCYASDCRAGRGGRGEREIKGVNSYILKRIATMASNSGAKFVQFTGDLISGYKTSTYEVRLEYANWLRTVEPYAAYIPFIATMGNHEAIIYDLSDGNSRRSIARFPNRESAEYVFADLFVNPENGPQSEDGSAYDPDPDKIDFPSYRENVFYYTYDNVAVICLNSDYWYSPSWDGITKIGGNLHGYLMDKQMKWLETTLSMIENDRNIDHIFVTQHTPAFPNGGHAYDDMWYYGDNRFRPYIAGRPVSKGIIERRDEYLDLLINKSTKVVAILAGDEHNYSRMKINSDTEIYPQEYEEDKLMLHRSIWHITNGSAGAPYYGQEELPWSSSVEKFTAQYALVFFEINGKEVWCEVKNPDTGEFIERVRLK